MQDSRTDMATYEELKVFSGNANPELARTICAYLGIPLGQVEVFKFSNDNTFVRIMENVRQRDVFLVQGLTAPTNDHVMELLIMVDALRRSSANSITAVIPYFGYARQDRKAAPRVPITARLVADLIEKSGVVITNNHVIQGADEIKVILHDNRLLKAELIGRDAKTDIAVLKINSQDDLTPVSFGNSDELRVGDWVVAIGNPFFGSAILNCFSLILLNLSNESLGSRLRPPPRWSFDSRSPLPIWAAVKRSRFIAPGTRPWWSKAPKW